MIKKPPIARGVDLEEEEEEERVPPSQLLRGLEEGLIARVSADETEGRARDDFS